MIDYNLHQHTLFSDGKDTPDSFARRALEIGFKAIGFTEHSPLPFENPFSLREERVDEYISSIEGLRSAYEGRLRIYRALEMDFIPGMSDDFDYWRERCRADYLIGSVHLVGEGDHKDLWFTDGPDYRIYDQGIATFFGGDVRKAVGAFYAQSNRMIESQRFEIIGHFDKIKMHNRDRFFTEEEKWYRMLVDETLELIKAHGIIVEINTRGLYTGRSSSLFPGGYALERVRELGLPIVLSSDAHLPEEINRLFDPTTTYLRNIGFREVVVPDNGKWLARPLS